MFYRSINTDKDDTCFIEVLILIRMTHVYRSMNTDKDDTCFIEV